MINDYTLWLSKHNSNYWDFIHKMIKSTDYIQCGYSSLSSFRFAFYNILKIRSNYGRCHKKNQSISTERKPCIYVAFFLLNVWHLFDCVCACLRPFTKKTQSVWNSWNVREQINGFALTTFLSSAKSLSLLL